MTKRHRDSGEMTAMFGRLSRAMVRRAGEGDIEALTALRDIRDQVDQAIGDAARALHAYPDLSWSVIAQELGISRQAARQRFGTER